MSSISKLSTIFLFVIAGASFPAGANAACVTRGGTFFLQNDVVSAIATMDGAECVQPYTSGGTTIFRSRVILSRPQNGTLSEIGLVGTSYKPKAGFKGQDNYSVKVCGETRRGTGCSTLNVAITVN